MAKVAVLSSKRIHMGNRNASKLFGCIVLFFLFDAVLAQEPKHEKMEQLSFLVGEWVGTSKLTKMA